jgi:hypothetical protein
MRKRKFTSAKTAASPNVDLVERRRLEFDNGFAGRLQFRLGALFVAQLVDAAMLVNLDRFQKISTTIWLAGSSEKFKGAWPTKSCQRSALSFSVDKREVWLEG